MNIGEESEEEWRGSGSGSSQNEWILPLGRALECILLWEVE